MGTSSINALLPHEPDLDCFQDHCFSCGVDEYCDSHLGHYIRCRECGHIYRTAKELRREYRRMSWENHRGYIRSSPWIFSNQFTPSTLSVLWRTLTIRAKNIYFCQKCIHDF